jgi:hypothetical protein
LRGTNTTTATDPRLWWLLVSRGPELELRRRKTEGSWRFICPVDMSHAVTMVNGRAPLGLALTCHGPAGSDSPGHALSVHLYERRPALIHVPWPCRWCGCAESQVLAALAARPRDKYRQAGAVPCSRKCGGSGYSVDRRPALCLMHLADSAGLAREVLFGEQTATA